MAEKRLNEEQLREYVEKEVSMALLNEEIDEGVLDFLTGGKSGTNTGALGSTLSKLIPGFSWETLIGGILGRIAIEPILKNILEKIGIKADGDVGRAILHAVSVYGGAKIGDWVDKKWNPIGDSNNPQLNS